MTISYDGWLVALSVAVATLASFTALDLARRVAGARGAAGWLWLAGGAIAMGTGIWSMHFIGMLAFRLPIAVSYNVPITVASWLVAVVVSLFALGTVSRKNLGLARLVFGSILMGAGISLMHYTGMAALEVRPSITYDPGMFLGSVVVAIVVSAAALVLTFRLRREEGPWRIPLRLLAALVMGLAICAMHYTGMGAANFSPFTICTGASMIGNSWLAGATGAVTVGLLAMVLLLSLMGMRSEHLALSLNAANAQLEQRAIRDALTGLPNRLLLEASLNQAIHSAQRHGEPFALMFLDIDHFKRVNDSFGHAAGDALLLEIAERLKGCVRGVDIVARLGGDEFVILLQRIRGPAEAARVARTVIGVVEAPVQCGPVELRVSASVGVALFPENGDDSKALLSNADAAMYDAKRKGRGVVSFFTTELTLSARERVEMEAALRKAIEQRELELHYQPKINVRTARIVGMEALVRWRRPGVGLVYPAKFVPIAEEGRLIMLLGAWVLEEACRQNRQWHDEGLPKLRVAVNISAAQFREDGFYEHVVQALRTTGLDGRYLELEITESTVMPQPEAAAAILERISALGVHVSVDDFGTGHSSLASLRRFQLDKLKIDQSFIRDLASSEDAAAIVQAIVSLAHILRLKVIAEGVETEEQLDRLRALNCDQYQGNFCSPALDAAKFAAFVASHDGSMEVPALRMAAAA